MYMLVTNSLDRGWRGPSEKLLLTPLPFVLTCLAVHWISLHLVRLSSKLERCSTLWQLGSYCFRLTLNRRDVRDVKHNPSCKKLQTSLATLITVVCENNGRKHLCQAHPMTFLWQAMHGCSNGSERRVTYADQHFPNCILHTSYVSYLTSRAPIFVLSLKSWSNGIVRGLSVLNHSLDQCAQLDMTFDGAFGLDRFQSKHITCTAIATNEFHTLGAM